MINPFAKVSVYNVISGVNIVTWDLNPQFPVNGTCVFEVFRSRSGVGAWESVGTVTDGHLLEDTVRRIYGIVPRLYYYVKMTDTDGNVYASNVKNAFGNLSNRDSSIVSEILRKEYMYMRTYTGICGCLLKRRHWGTACTECLDFDTGDITSGQCDVCYGTGVVGGYFDPVSYYISESGNAPKRIEQSQAGGTSENAVTVARGIVCPCVDTKDVWVNGQTDERYMVQKVKTISYRGVPVIYDSIELRLIPTTDIIYQFDITGSSSS